MIDTLVHARRSNLGRAGSRQDLELLTTTQHRVVDELEDQVDVLVGHVAMDVPALKVDVLVGAQILQDDVLAIQRGLENTDGTRYVAVSLVLNGVLWRHAVSLVGEGRCLVGVGARAQRITG